jgi:hemerythrin superfamily protein
MLRDKNLVPLSHQHQHALALCVRIDRALQAGDVELAAWQHEIRQIFEQEIAVHFEAEEKQLFPEVERFRELQALVGDLRAEHDVLRRYFASARASQMNRDELGTFAAALSAHVRKEERQLFEELQRLAKPEELTRLGAALNQALAQASDACLLPNPATRLRARKDIKAGDK